MQPTILTLNDISVAHRGFVILHDVSISLQSGELVSITGPSGSGKTTLLRAVAGLIDVCKGEILYKGELPARIGLPRYRRQVVLFDQQPRLFDYTVRYNLERPFHYRINNGLKFPEERARQLLNRLELEDDVLDHNARQLSVGQQQRISLVRGLLIEPEVALLDEPTSALDEDSTAIVEELVRQEAELRGMSALIVIHNRDQAKRWCNRNFDLSGCIAKGIKAECRAIKECEEIDG